METGQIVKFRIPITGEDPNQKYVLLELFEDALPPRAKIMALDTGLPFPPINSVLPSDLETVKVATEGLRNYISAVGKKVVEV